MTASSSLENQGLAQKLLLPSDAAQVQSILREAMEQKIGVCVYTTPTSRDIKLDLSRMNHVIDIDTANLVAVVEPGISLCNLKTALSGHCLRFVPADTPFYEEKTIGEFYYAGRSNISSLKYGAAKHFLMGSEIILPDGQLLKTGGKTVKNVTGYDLTRFMNAPFAAFGVTVKFLLKLLPLPEAKQSVVTGFESMEHLCGFVTALRLAKITPAYFLWIDSQTQKLMIGQEDGPVPDLVLFQLDGITEEVAQKWEIISHLLEKFHAVNSRVSGTDHNDASAWTGLFTSPKGLIVADDLKVKTTALWSFIDKFYTLAKDENILAGLFGQIAEGKINVFLDGDAPNRLEFLKRVISVISVEGGYSSGRLNRTLGLATTGPLVPIEQGLKQLFDPHGIVKG